MKNLFFRQTGIWISVTKNNQFFPYQLNSCCALATTGSQTRVHLSPRPQWLRQLSILRRWFCCWWFIIYCCSHCLCCCVCLVLFCYSALYVLLVLQSHWWERKDWWLLDLNCVWCLVSIYGLWPFLTVS